MVSQTLIGAVWRSLGLFFDLCGKKTCQQTSVNNSRSTHTSSLHPTAKGLSLVFTVTGSGQSILLINLVATEMMSHPTSLTLFSDIEGGHRYIFLCLLCIFPPKTSISSPGSPLNQIDHFIVNVTTSSVDPF